MKKGNIRKLIASALLMVAPVSMASCSFFNTEETSIVAISNVEVETAENGDTVVTIYYTDESMEPTTFTIPKGNDGKEGNGIESVTYTPLEDGSGTIVTITFTDESMEPVTFTILNGEGKRGDDGAGMVDVIYEHDDENHRTAITMTFNDGREPVIVYIPDGEQGEKGTSVVSITNEATSDGTSYVISFYDENGNVISSINIDKPNGWYSGTSTPEASLGYNGDFYFETTHYYVYQKLDGNWVKIAELGAAKSNETMYTVTFDVNDTPEAPAQIVNGRSVYTIQEGMNFYNSGYDVPVAFRTGFEFKGWITSKNYDVTKGLFTDLTTVYKDTKLYAYWEAK